VGSLVRRRLKRTSVPPAQARRYVRLRGCRVEGRNRVRRSVATQPCAWRRLNGGHSGRHRHHAARVLPSIGSSNTERSFLLGNRTRGARDEYESDKISWLSHVVSPLQASQIVAQIVAKAAP
jgi:hypothetical protein